MVSLQAYLQVFFAHITNLPFQYTLTTLTPALPSLLNASTKSITNITLDSIYTFQIIMPQRNQHNRHHPYHHQLVTHPQQIAKLNVQIQDSLDQILIYTNSDPTLLAKQFLQKHKLPLHLIPSLSHKITLNRQRALQQLQQPSFQLSPSKMQQANRNNQRHVISNKKAEVVGKKTSKASSFHNSKQMKQICENTNTINAFYRNSKTYNNQITHAETYSVNNTFQSINLSSQQSRKQVKDLIVNKINSIVAKHPKDIKKNVYQRLSKPKKEFCKMNRVKQRKVQQNGGNLESLLNRLYGKPLSKKMYAQRLSARSKVQKQNQELKQCTHTPQINHISQKLVGQRHGKIQERLILQKKYIDQKIENKRCQKLQKAQSQCSFRPYIGMISKQLAKQNKLSNRFSSSLRRSHCQFQKPSFQPRINNLSKKLAQNKGDFFQRTGRYLQHKMCKQRQLKQLQSFKNKYDFQTGKTLFHPNVQDYPLPNRNIENKKIGDYLHSVKRKELFHQQPNVFKSSQLSNLINQCVKQKRLNQIFSQLDKNQTGKISPSQICIDEMEQNVLEIISPVLFQMEQFQHQLNREQFRMAVLQLDKQLSSTEKAILYKYSKKGCKEQLPSFRVVNCNQPKINSYKGVNK